MSQFVLISLREMPIHLAERDQYFRAETTSVDGVIEYAAGDGNSAMDNRPVVGTRLAFLDAARGLAALVVILSHGLQICLPPSYSAWVNANFDMGRAGVILFLLISGFIIPASLEQGGSNARFWFCRFFRLFPAYWFSIVLAYVHLLLGGTGLAVEQGDTATWLTNITMLQGFLGYADVWGVFWTLTLELVIYATCSLLFACGLLRRIGAAACVTVFLVCAAWALAQPLVFGRPYVLDVWRSLYLAPMVGLVAQRYVSGRTSRTRFHAVVAAQVILAVLVWAVNRHLFPHHTERMGLRTLLTNWGAPYACFLLLLEARHHRMPFVACWLGRISYSLYLLHPLVLLWVVPDGKSIGVYLAAIFAVSIALAAIAYFLIEEPGIALGRFLENRFFPRRNPLVSSPSSSEPPEHACAVCDFLHQSAACVDVQPVLY